VNVKSNTSQLKSAMSIAQKSARIDLAACHRLAVFNGFNEGIDNHITRMVPGETDRFYLAPYGLHWSEVRARDFLVVTFSRQVESGVGVPEDSAFCIHAPIHRLHPTAKCIIHTHMPYATALSMLEDVVLESASQTAAGFANTIAYDRSYQGLACDPAEGERLAQTLGKATALLMANHGALVVAETVAEAFERLYYLERACQLQVLAMSTGRKLRMIEPHIIEKTMQQFETATFVGDRKRYDYHFSALKRMLDRREPNYSEL
jgi:ribulose-5-phosphate 4-epimerase/fuculose-1-phosphate aldolase